MAKSSPFATTDLRGGSYGSTYNSAGILSLARTPTPTNSGTNSDGVNPLDLRAAVNDLLGFKADAEKNTAAAAGSRLTAEGAAIEADAYGKASAAALEGSREEALYEGVREVQIANQVNQTLGDIKAQVAGGNFQQSGSALDIIAASANQGYISQSISAYQSSQTQRGLTDQSIAATGEQSAALVRQKSAEQLATQYDTAATSATATAAALTSTLNQLLQGDENAQNLTADLLAGNTTNLPADVLAYNPVGKDQPLATSPEVKPTTTTSIQSLIS